MVWVEDEIAGEMNKKFLIGLATFAGIFGYAAYADAQDREYTRLLNTFNDFTKPFDDTYLWENGQEQNDIDKKILTLAALSLVDLNQSKDMFASKNYYEMNPVLGPHPSLPKMASFGLAGIGAVYVSEKLLSKYPKLQQVFVDSVISTEAFNVQENNRLMQIGSRSFTAMPIIITVRW